MPDWIGHVHLTAADAADARRVAADVRRGCPLEGAGRRLGDAVPALRGLRERVDRHGALILRGLPLDDDALVACATLCGAPAMQGRDGLVYSVRPTAGDGADASHSRTKAGFDLHTDSTLDARPHRYIALAVVRSDPSGGRTILSRLSCVLGELGAGAKEALLEEAAPFAWERQFAEQPCVTHHRVLFRQGGRLRVRWRGDLVRAGCELAPVSRRLRSAIEEFAATVERVASEPLLLEAGEVLIVDNSRVLHGRTTVRSSDRELKRMKIHLRTGLAVSPGSS